MRDSNRDQRADERDAQHFNRSRRLHPQCSVYLQTEYGAKHALQKVWYEQVSGVPMQKTTASPANSSGEACSRDRHERRNSRRSIHSVLEWQVACHVSSASRRAYVVAGGRVVVDERQVAERVQAIAEELLARGVGTARGRKGRAELRLLDS
jgi:hypothetical protein